jgi:D-alanyl-D-alanine carboxypeptidase
MRGISRRQFVCAIAGLAAAAATRCGSSGNNDSLSQNQIQAAELILRRLVSTNAVPGITYAIGNRSRSLARGAFGLRVISPAASMNIQTRSALASVSKQFVSAAAFLLQQQDALSVSAPLSDYVPDYVHSSVMTLSQVLTMRSGIPAHDAVCEAPIDGEINESTLIANLNKHPLDFPPGRYFAYSNCAYNVAGVAIQRVSGMSYADFIARNFFGPLGMTSSYQLGSRTDSNFAQGYAPEGTGWMTESFTVADAAFASGNLVSTPTDLQSWNRSLLNATLLSTATLREIFTLPSTPDTAISHYASGWFIEPSGVIWHPGALNGYGTVNMLFPMTGHAITLLANSAPHHHWDRGGTALAIYNAASLGPMLPPLLPVVRTTVPH